MSGVWLDPSEKRDAMKPAPFEYSRPSSLDEACALLVADDGAHLIAGGQTLVPMMAMRLVRPTRLVDIARIPGLAFVREESDAVVIGATTLQRVVENDPFVRAKLPLLAAAMPWVGHAATRARGTIGGSLANADPAAELALIAVTLGATLVHRDGDGVSRTKASDFFTGLMSTVLPATGCLTEVHFPIWRELRLGVGFHEVSARRSDFAYVSAAAQIALEDDESCRRMTIGIGAATAVPVRLDAVAAALAGKRVTEATARDAVLASMAGLEFLSDPHATADYRRRVAASLAVRAIMDAYASAQGRRSHAR
jgi:CO/xanthine dehydrogenase FAD-binding subunit